MSMWFLSRFPPCGECPRTILADHESPEASCHPRTAEIACNIGPRTQLPMVSVLTVINFLPSRMVGEYLMTGYTLNAMPLEEGRLVKSAQW